jgi:transketolase
LKDSAGAPDIILIATGSEVALAMDAAKALEQKNRRVRVVSMPSTNVFEAQDAAYREQVLPRAVERRVAIEAAATEGWYRYVGLRGAVVGMHSFGASGVAKDLFKHFGFTVDNVVQTAERVLSN